MEAADPTLTAGSLTLDEAQDVVTADDTIVDASIGEQLAAELQRSVPPSRLPSSIPPLALPSLPPPRPATDATHVGLVAGALAAAALLIAVVSVPQLMVRRDRTWVAPTLLSASDPRVMEVADELARTTAERITLEDERTGLRTRLDELDAVPAPSEGDAKLRASLAKKLKRTQERIAEREQLSLVPSNELNAELKETKRKIKALGAAQQSVAADPEKPELTAKLAAVDAALAANEAHREELDAIPFRAAIDGDIALAFVPDENAVNVEERRSLLACRWGTLLCKRVGTVGTDFDVPALDANPISGELTHGRYVHVAWTDANAARRRMLFVR